MNNIKKMDYHRSYKVSCNHFINGRRCPYCSISASNKVHPLDSFGYLYPDKAKCWHEDNDKSPYEVSPGSGKKFKFRCNKCGNIFIKRLDGMSEILVCKECRISNGEIQIKKYLDNNRISYIHDKPYFNDLIGIGGNPLRPDFILPEHKIWIEYDGEFHFKNTVKNQSDYAFDILNEHDERKNEYAKKHGWKMIRIPYTKFDEIKNILDKELN